MNQRKLDLDPIARGALLAVFELASEAQPVDAGRVARALHITSVEAAEALLSLDRAGLLWAERCSLTMKGLAVAARLNAKRVKRRAA